MRRPLLARGAVFCSAVALLVSTVGALPAGAQEGTAEAVPGMRWLSDIWCATDGSCLGVGFTPDDVGAVVELRAVGRSGPVRPVPGTDNLSQITCAPGGGCIAVGKGGGQGVVVEMSRDGTPASVRAVPATTDLFDVACPTATTCIATGYLFTPTSTYPYQTSSPVFVVVDNGQPEPAQRFPRGTRRAVGIACPSTTICLTVASTGVVVTTKFNGTWIPTLHRSSSDDASGYPTDEISCPSSSTCYTTAVGFIPSGTGYVGVPAMMAVSPNGIAGPVQILNNDPGTLNDISCVSGRGRPCTVVGQESATSQGLVIDVMSGSPMAATKWANSNFFTGVSCIAAATCGIVGNTPTGAVFGWHGPAPA